MSKVNIHKVVDEINKELGFNAISIKLITKTESFNDSAIRHKFDSTLDAFVKLKNTKVLQNYERLHWVNLRLYQDKLFLSF